MSRENELNGGFATFKNLIISKSVNEKQTKHAFFKEYYEVLNVFVWQDGQQLMSLKPWDRVHIEKLVRSWRKNCGAFIEPKIS